MVFQFYFKKMYSSDALKSLSQRKLSDVIERFLGDSGLVRITFSTEKTSQKIHCYFQGWNGTVLNASGASENMYAAIDLVAQKLEAQLSRHKVRTRRRSRLPVAQGRGLMVAGGSYSFPTSADWDDDQEPELAEVNSFQLLH
jgi:putative sigma-54 modulation protein